MASARKMNLNCFQVVLIYILTPPYFYQLWVSASQQSPQTKHPSSVLYKQCNDKRPRQPYYQSNIRIFNVLVIMLACSTWNKNRAGAHSACQIQMYHCCNLFEIKVLTHLTPPTLPYVVTGKCLACLRCGPVEGRALDRS